MAANEALIIDLMPLASSTASSFARSYPPCNREDIEADLFLCLVENAGRLPSLILAAEQTRDAEEKKDRTDPKSVISRMLRDRATLFCRKERAEVGIMHNAYWYARPDVEKALDSWFDYDNWLDYIKTQGPSDGQRIYAGRNPAGSDDEGAPRGGQVIYHDDRAEGLTVLADISRVYEKLKVSYRVVLEDTHVGGYTRAEIAFAEGVSESAIKKRYLAAVDALCDYMNGVR